MRPAPRVAPRKAVILLSGGLDSTLAARILQEQGIDLHAIHFTSPFCTCSGNGGCRSQAHAVAGRMGIPIRTVSKGEEYLEIVKSPRHGRFDFSKILDALANRQLRQGYARLDFDLTSGDSLVNFLAAQANNRQLRPGWRVEWFIAKIAYDRLGCPVSALYCFDYE